MFWLVFNNIWSSACLCLEVSGLVLACVQQYCRMAGLVLACVQQYCRTAVACVQQYCICLMFISIWSCSGLCSIISGLKYLV